MIPIRDNIPARTTPVVNLAMIGLCGLGFLAQLAASSPTGDSLVERFGMIPRRVLKPDESVEVRERVASVRRIGARQFIVEEDQVRRLAEPPMNAWFTLLTCIFLHGGWMHFLGNMWFLYIFGDNVEDRMGHIPYALFYLFCGVGASVAHLASNPSSTMPTIGASGAIAGVMGAYFLLYPKAKVLTVVPIFVLMYPVVLPAPIFLGVWFALQFFQGTLSVASTESGGVAWWAHIGGFAVGYLIALILRAVGETRPPVDARRAEPDRIGISRRQL